MTISSHTSCIMKINRDNIFNFTVSAKQTPEKDDKQKKPDQDEQRTKALIDMLEGFNFQIHTKPNYIFINEAQRLYMVPENGDMSRRHSISEKRLCERFVQSETGQFLAVYTPGTCAVLKVQEDALYKSLDDPANVYFEIAMSNLPNIRFSKSERLLVLQTRSLSIIIDLKTKQTLFSKTFQLEESFKMKSNPLLFENEASFYFFTSPSTIQLFDIARKKAKDGDEMLNISEGSSKEFKIPRGGIASSVAMTADNGLCILCLNTKVALITDDNLTPIFALELPQESFHEAQIKMSKDLQSALILFTNYLDDSGKSYYGTNRLQLINMHLGKSADVLTVRGPIHSIAWNPNSTEFIAFSGHMPAHSIIYSNFGDSRIQLGVLYANFAKWSPDSKLIAIGGFGSLDTGLSIYDSADLKVVSHVKTEQATSFKWLDDSKRFIMAILFHKLKVANCFRLYSIDGSLLLKLNFSKTQLLKVRFSSFSKLNRQILKEHNRVRD